MHKMVILFLFPEFGNFLLEIRKEHTFFVIGNKTLYQLSKWTRNNPDNVNIPDVYCMFDNNLKKNIPLK